MPWASMARTCRKYAPSGRAEKRASLPENWPLRSTWLPCASSLTLTRQPCALSHCGSGRLSHCASSLREGSSPAAGAGNKGATGPAWPSALTAMPVRASKTAVGEVFSASASDCTVVRPFKTAEVVRPSASNCISNSVPRTLVEATGVTMSRRRCASGFPGTCTCTPPCWTCSTDCKLPERPRRRSWLSSTCEVACTRTVLPSARRTATKALGSSLI